MSALFEGFIVDSLPLPWERFTFLYATRIIACACIRTILQVPKNPKRNLLVSDVLAWTLFFGYHYIWTQVIPSDSLLLAYDAHVSYSCWIICNAMWYIHHQALYTRLIARDARIAALCAGYLAFVVVYLLELPEYAFTGVGCCVHLMLFGMWMWKK